MLALERPDRGEGGALYQFVFNGPIGFVDPYGLEFTVAVEERSVAYITEVAGAGAMGWTSIVDSSTEGEDDILEFRGTRKECCHCAGVKKGMTMNIHVHQLLPNESEVGETMTARGRDDAIEHENKRNSVYRLGYNAFLAPSQGRGQHVTRCNNVCSRKPGEAKRLLLEYLENLRTKAAAEWMDYIMREQNDTGINSENAEGNFRHMPLIQADGNISYLFDGIIKKYTVKLPWRFTPPACPKGCP